MNPDTLVETTDATVMPSNFCAEVSWLFISQVTDVADDHAVATQLLADTEAVAVGSALMLKLSPETVTIPPLVVAVLSGAR